MKHIEKIFGRIIPTKEERALNKAWFEYNMLLAAYLLRGITPNVIERRLSKIKQNISKHSS